MKCFDTRYWPWGRSRDSGQRGLEKLDGGMWWFPSDATQGRERERQRERGGERETERERQRDREDRDRQMENEREKTEMMIDQANK